MELSINEVTFIYVAIKFELAMACLLAIYEVTSVLNLIILPLFCTFSVIHIVKPFTVVHGPVLINKNTIATSFALFPLTMVNITVLVRDSSLSVEETLVSHTLIHRAVWELDETKTFPSGLVLIGLPLTLVLATFSNVNKESVPVVALAATLSTELIRKIIISEKRLLRGHQLSFKIDWLLLTSNRQ